ncbi:hypothetical protein KSC_070440 [Ktedonobacter sp. SOSP1-52]|uniref:DUF5107 domain-containing protein n=1 Tax=Ktedonobacter sp. SOSP1-52 TaxID=2778366 RepID=UPI0019154FE1|nr:DUF5107 domain-containing protein [Ktedonobacter sp. SOSP1-52]GHO68152.1 hypothetical protein KSC_070440 [Ktedonobacter sp. SOSP1-52]
MEEQSSSQVRVWEEDVVIPTYATGQPDKNPMFLEKRVYQGSSGKVYPYPVISKIENEKTLQSYHLLCLENEYLHIELLPELGGRIYRALDKTNNYDFVYYNRVIKPALVGLTGPWISGGIEFNWPQHHRPNTYGPVEYRITHNQDESKTIWVSEIDRMYGTKMTAGFTLHPGKAYLEIQVQLYNRTPQPQTFLWWANPAFAVNEHTQSVFPPDVHAVFDHGRRDVSRFPIATGTYYKMDYSAGVDISWYKNIPVPTSYMAYQSRYDFIGGYDHALQAGLLHVANHHISPGKKQWTWGNGEFGKAWDRNLTDEDGPYVELMVGVFTDNQPDFSWLQPYETKSFNQYFMPYKNIGLVKNASIDAAVNLEIDDVNHLASIQVYATALFSGAVIDLRGKHQHYLHEVTMLSPIQTFTTMVPLNHEEQANDVTITVRDAQGRLLVAYTPVQSEIAKLPEPASPLGTPETLSNNEALYLAGQHLEQYRHATFEPDPYYLEGLKRDPGDSRINVAYGKLLLQRGLFRTSESYFRTAIATLTRYHPNPYDSEAYYQLGLSLKFQGRLDEAFAALYKSTWSEAWQSAGYFTLAQIACMHQQYTEALQLVELSLQHHTYNYKARHLKTALLRKQGHVDEAMHLSIETTQFDVADFGAYYERILLHRVKGEETQAKDNEAQLAALMRGDVHNYIALATDYAHSGLYEESIALLSRLAGENHENLSPMVHYYLAYFHDQAGQPEQAQTQRHTARNAPTDYCFPNSLDDLIVLEHATNADASDAQAHYYLGNLLYDKKRHTDAIHHWETSRARDTGFATVHRNLALAYYNALQQPEQALRSLETAFACDPTDARVLYELDQLRKKIGVASEERLASLEKHRGLVIERDDLYLEYVTLLNTLQRYEEVLALLTEHIFHPWEGGEGQVARQYIFVHVELGKRALLVRDSQQAIDTLQRALIYPENLAEGKLTGTLENNIYYYLGCAYAEQGLVDNARECFQRAAHGLEEPTSAMFYNDQPPDMIFYQGLAQLQLQDQQKARSRFHKLIDYGEQHLFDAVKIDYFAVSLPDFLVFESDQDKQNEIHCHYMLGLGHLGLQEYEQARTHFEHVLRLESYHQGAKVHLAVCSDPALLFISSKEA